MTTVLQGFKESCLIETKTEKNLLTEFQNYDEVAVLALGIGFTFFSTFKQQCHVGTFRIVLQRH